MKKENLEKILEEIRKFEEVPRCSLMKNGGLRHYIEKILAKRQKQDEDEFTFWLISELGNFRNVLLGLLAK